MRERLTGSKDLGRFKSGRVPRPCRGRSDSADGCVGLWLRRTECSPRRNSLIERGLTIWSSVASVASPLQRRVRPTSRPRGRCDVQPWSEARRSGSEDGCCDGGPESGLGPEERRGVSGAQVAGCDQNEYLAAISRGKGAGRAHGLFGFDRNAPLASLARCRPSLGRAVGEAQHESPGISCGSRS